MLKHSFPLFFLAFSLQAQATGEIYCCQDGGRRLCADTLPAQCRGHAYSVLDNAGNIIKEVAAPLTAEQKAERAREESIQKQAEEQKREQRRKDQALLDTYNSLADIDRSQQRAEEEIRTAIQGAQARVDKAVQERKKLDAEAEFYKKRSLPAELDKSLRATNHAIKVESETLDVKKRELELVKAKYDADRKRFVELTASRKANGQR